MLLTVSVAAEKSYCTVICIDLALQCTLMVGAAQKYLAKSVGSSSSEFRRIFTEK